jgi:hypothetical protein
MCTCIYTLHDIVELQHVHVTGKGKHIEFSDVGQNTVELWTLEAGGGWVHPVHIHLVVSA